MEETYDNVNDDVDDDDNNDNDDNDNDNNLATFSIEVK